MHRVDINHDGVIQLTEFVAGLVDWKQLQNDTQAGRAPGAGAAASCTAMGVRVRATPPSKPACHARPGQGRPQAAQL